MHSIAGGVPPMHMATQLSARTIMRANFFGVEEAIKYFRANPTRMQLSVLSDIPFSEETLEECNETHVLVAYLPMSVLDVRAIVKRELFLDQKWYTPESFAHKHGTLGWYLIRKTAVPQSIGKTWEEQLTLLRKDEEVPRACVVTYVIVGHCRATGEHLFEDMCVCCSDACSGGTHVCVGYGLCTDTEPVGLAAARIPHTFDSSKNATVLPLHQPRCLPGRIVSD